MYNWPCGIFLILIVCELFFVRWGFLIPIVLISYDRFSLCRIPIKHDFLPFLELYHLRCGLLDHVIKRSTSFSLLNTLMISYTFRWHLITVIRQKRQRQKRHKCIWLKKQRHKNEFIFRIILEWIYVLIKHEIQRAHVSRDNIFLIFIPKISM